jgi:pSer/pThr/pTyr-binding forkhead associated (FHA) protein
MGSNYIKITVMSGADDGKVFELYKIPVIMGRHVDDDVWLKYDNRVSRHHARITQQGDVYFIEDIGPEGKGSTNGTYVENERIETTVPVKSGEIILLGSVWIKFESGITRSG